MFCALLLSCSPDPATDRAIPADSGGCDNIAILDWDNFGHGFLLENCDGCHAATSEHRQDAPGATTFDTVAQAWSWAPQILAAATGTTPTMPPRGGVSDDDRTRLFWWLGCGTAGT